MLWQAIALVATCAASCWFVVGILLAVREFRSERRVLARIQRERRARYASGDGGRPL